MSARGSRFSFTLNNYTDDVIFALNIWLVEHTTFAVYGKEVGEGGTPHLQGYFEKERSRIGPLGRLRFEGVGWHIEVARGTGTRNKEYCSKGEQSHAEWELDGASGLTFGLNADVWTHGELRKSDQGKRSDLDKVKKLIHDGVITNEKALADAYGVNYQAFRMGCTVLEHRRRAPSRDPPVVFWLFGPTGSGKSRAVAKFISDCVARRGWDYWKSVGALKWFNGYSGQEIAWFDDYRFAGRQDSEKFAFFLNLLDRYSLSVEFKGGVTDWYPKIILVTTPQDVAGTFASISEFEDLAQVRRRVSQFFDFGAQGASEFAGSIVPHLAGRERGRSGPLDLTQLDPFGAGGAIEEKAADSDDESVATVPYDPPPQALAGFGDDGSDTDSVDIMA